MKIESGLCVFLMSCHERLFLGKGEMSDEYIMNVN